MIRESDPIERNGILLLEARDLSDFFDEFMEVRTELLKKEEKEQEVLRDLADKLDAAAVGMIEKFIDEPEFRKKLLYVLSEFPIHLISGFVSFLNKCIDVTWARSASYGAFEGYNQNLQIYPRYTHFLSRQ